MWWTCGPPEPFRESRGALQGMRARALQAGSAEACGARGVSHEVPFLFGACAQAWAVSMAQVAPYVLRTSEHLVPWSFGHFILGTVFFVMVPQDGMG